MCIHTVARAASLLLYNYPNQPCTPRRRPVDSKNLLIHLQSTATHWRASMFEQHLLPSSQYSPIILHLGASSPSPRKVCPTEARWNDVPRVGNQYTLPAAPLPCLTTTAKTKFGMEKRYNIRELHQNNVILRCKLKQCGLEQCGGFLF